MPKIDTLDALEEHEEHDDDYQTITAQLCSAQTLAHSPALRRREPQKYTYSYQKWINLGW